jgi:two-component system, LytTR family, response regulator
MRALRAAIVDDEPLARARLVRLLGAETAVEIVGEYADGGATAALLASGAEVVFLDVRMPEIDGFTMLQRLPASRRPLVVFVTAYSEHALHAFDSEAVDYLVKPVSGERLHVAVSRVRERLSARERSLAGDYLQRLAVPDGGRVQIVKVADIECALAQGNYVELQLPGRKLLLRETLSRLEARLDPRVFLRIHRSRIVRIDIIEQVEPYGAGQCWLRLRNGACMTSGRSYRVQLRRVLGLEGD